MGIGINFAEKTHRVDGYKPRRSAFGKECRPLSAYMPLPASNLPSTRPDDKKGLNNRGQETAAISGLVSF